MDQTLAPRDPTSREEVIWRWGEKHGSLRGLRPHGLRCDLPRQCSYNILVTSLCLVRASQRCIPPHEGSSMNFNWEFRTWRRLREQNQRFFQGTPIELSVSLGPGFSRRAGIAKGDRTGRRKPLRLGCVIRLCRSADRRSLIYNWGALDGSYPRFWVGCAVAVRSLPIAVCCVSRLESGRIWFWRRKWR